VTDWNAFLTRAFDLVLSPFARLSPMAGLVVLSLVTAVAVLYAFKWTANQAALVRSKRAMQAAVFEMRLFNDDLAALGRAQWQVLRHTLGYLRASFAPTLWLIVPMAFLMVHMEFHFGYTGFGVGQPALLTLRFVEGAPVLASARASGRAPVTLEAPAHVRVETPAVVLPSAREISWRVRPTAEGAYQLLVQFETATMPVSLVAGARVGRRVPLRPSAGFVAQFLNPSEPPVGDDARLGLEAVTLDYPRREVMVAGWDVGWAVVYLALTLALAFLLKGPLGVEM
jgi:hypothetical protein